MNSKTGTRDSAGRDLILFILILLLAMTGLLILYPASALTAKLETGNPEFFINKQLLWFVIGLAGMFVAATVPLERVRTLSLPLLILSLVLLILVFVPGIGHSVHSSNESFHRWLGYGGVTFQPSEFSKLAIIFYAAHILARNLKEDSEYDYMKLIPPAILIGLVLVAIVVEPQYGTTICILGAGVVLVYVSGFPMIRLFLLFIASLPILLLLGLLQKYRLERFRVWLDPYEYRFQGGYQLVMSFRSFEEGGIFGTEIASGIGHRYLTYGYSDFVLALFAEDYGLMGVFFLILLFLLFSWRVVWNLRKIYEPFPFLLGAGSLAMLVGQALLNMSVVTGILPTTGVSLPFVSYGGSSLVTSLIFGGLLLNVSRYAGGHFFANDLHSGSEGRNLAGEDEPEDAT